MKKIFVKPQATISAMQAEQLLTNSIQSDPSTGISGGGSTTNGNITGGKVDAKAGAAMPKMNF